MGTIWSSSPWMRSIGTSTRFRSSLKSLSENCSMQSCAAFRLTCMPISQNSSRIPCDTFEPGRLAP